MGYNEAQKQATARYKAKVGRKQVSFELNATQRIEWPAYAAYKGMSINDMIRDAIKRAMAADGWTYSQPEEQREQD